VQDADSVLRSLRGRVDGTGVITGLDDALDRWDAWAAQFKDAGDIELEVGGMPHPDEERPFAPPESGVGPAKFAVGDRICSRVDGGVITDVGWSVTGGERSYTINNPDSGRRAVWVFERDDEVRLG
jgi:hypothetical protein